jgi:opacity protein-like surface antigen
LGPPVAGLVEKQWSIGVDYGFMDGDIDTKDIGEGDFESNTILANIGYGLTDRVEIYGLIGASDGEIDDDLGLGDDFDSGYEAAYGFGVKVTLAEQDSISWGAVYQMLWVNPEDKVGVVDVEIEAFDIKAAFGPSYNANGIHIFGGPMLYYIDGDIDTDIGDTDIDQDAQFGGYVGVAVDLGTNMSLSGEYQYTHDVETIGASWRLRF